MLFSVLAVCILALNIWKAFRGMGSADEHFYTVLGFRFAGGDGLFRDDWHIAQMISFFIEPLVKGYLGIKGNTQGIILFMRLVYAVFALFCGIALYMRFHSYGPLACAAAAAWMLYTPFQIMALSYNTMSAGFVLLAVCMYKEDSDSWIRLFLTGVFASCAVINSPVLALFYMFLTFLTVLRPSVFPHRHWLGISAGVLASALVFLLWLNTHTPLGDIVGSLNHLIDPSHKGGVHQIIRNLMLLWRFFSVFLPVLILMPFAAWVLRKKDEKIKTVFRNTSCLVVLLAMIYAGLINGYQNYLGGHGTVLFSFTVYGLSQIILNQERGYPVTVFFISLFHSAVILISSNVGPRTFTAPMILACAMTILSERERLMSLSLPLVMTGVLIGLLVYGKVMDVYDGSGRYDRQIQEGPLAGLLDSSEEVQSYAKSLADIQDINSMDQPDAMLVTWNVWEYLALKKRITTFSTYPYFWEKEEYESAQEQYLQEHPDRRTGYVYLDQSDPPYDLQKDDPMFQRLKLVREMRNGILFEREAKE